MFCLEEVMISGFYLVLFVRLLLFHFEDDFIENGSELGKNKIIYIKREF